MIRYTLLTFLLVTLLNSLHAAVNLSAAAPTSDLISSSAAGTTDTALFAESVNANHARGQLFSLPDGAGTAYQISAITIRKNIAATYINDTITLRIFEGTQAQWDTGSGHSTNTDGNDYYVDTTVTPLHTENFNLNGLIPDDEYVTFQLAAPVFVNENSDFGFILTYNQSDPANPDSFRHLENGSGGGRLSISTTDHATSSRKMVYFIQGSVFNTTNNPSLTPPTATNITKNSATLGATVSSGSDITNHGTSYWTHAGQQGNNSSALGAIASTPYAIIDNRTSLTPSTLYTYSGFATNSADGTIHSTTNTFLTEPNPATSLVTTVTSSTSIDISWTDDPTADGAIVIIREGAAPTAPIDSTTYTGNLTYGNGDAAGGGYVIYSGSYPGSPISVTIPSGTYHIAVYSYSDDNGAQPKNYNNHDTPPSTSLIASQPLTLASPFQNRMVLQRDKPVNIWGTAFPNSSISVTINGITTSGNADPSGNWKIQIPALSAGGPYSLVVTDGSETKTITDVLIGDVWLCFGQSNMVFTMNQMDSWHDPFEAAIIANDNIRCLKIEQNGTLNEENTATMDWLANSTAGSWSAVGSMFAYHLNQSTNVPVAFIWAAWGSSSIEGWMPKEMTQLFPHFEEMLTLHQSISEYRSGATTSSRLPSPYTTNQEAIAGLAANGWSSNNDDIFMRTRPNIIYNKMIHPVLHYGISGFIWYQGEANSTDIRDAVQYRYTLPGLVKEYRERFNQGDLPFLGVGLPSINRNDADHWNWFRESQATIENMTNGHMLVSVDTGDTGTNIHPTDIGKGIIGERLALLARKYSLAENIVADGPRYSSMSISGNTITLEFDNSDGLKTSDNQSPDGFQIAGANMVFVDATNTAISGSQVTVSANSIASPVAVRYAWFKRTKTFVNLVNQTDLPAAPFRTDSFSISDLGAEAPQSVDDNYQIEMNSTLTVITAEGVLSNDFDLNDNDLTASVINDVSFGSLTLNPDGSFTYIPDTGYAGPDSFSYQVSDGTLNSAVATVNITIIGEQTGYYIWKSTIGWNPENDQSATADPDHDGINNFLEYALDSDPLVADTSGLPTLTASGDNFLYNFNNTRTDVSYEVQLSNSLNTWTDPAFLIVTSNTTMPVTIPGGQAANGKLFVRLKVSE